ncbi:RluA family pseudouridine synthase [Microvirga guangxiensis]|uniref:tRNA pseudouridine32 synthase / 23S rRNA pseudouridine746 synthase n=1 Tax=Microvirga guangxiensis TaxID=549386 RepID=A0A1G5DQ83_9HYPH|nr:RNA pseudouridine synthase [Microvirga guangxiensis]SCY16630.1 tRNA pseudouridine32 synthase / 23S rRNA pseudouridine746 synthase [Microvirga guangxiensis]
MNAEEIVSRLLYRDALMLVINKPASLPVHPGPKGGETLFHHLDALRFGLPRRPEAAHRLDKDTSGCLVLGRHPKAIARLNELFRNNGVDKVYWALVEGGPEADEGEIDLPLAPKSPDRGWWMKVDPKGQPSLTKWRVLGRSTSPSRGEVAPQAREGVEGASSENSVLPPHPGPLTRSHPPPQGESEKLLTLLELRPITGRTHQLRVHCAAMGFPIVGDPIYGTAPRFHGPGLHLHARSITVPLYPKKPPILVEAPLPEHMRERVKLCGGAV